MNREIGGYFELEQQLDHDIKEYHDQAVPLNLGRSGISFLAATMNIKAIFLPYFLCDSIENTCLLSKIQIKKYHIGPDFLPIITEKLSDNEFVYIVNYFGFLNNKILNNLKQKYKKIIVDNVQSFFSRPLKSVPTIYSCRKFFGVPDGGYIYSDKTIQLKDDSSSKRFKHLIGRKKTSGEEFFGEFRKNEDLLSTLPLLSMSNETNSIMKRINYKSVMSKRTKNFNYLNKRLSGLNQLVFGTIRGAFCYPLLVKNGQNLRKKLINNKIYVPILWPNLNNLNEFEQNLVSNLLILPCDQRYNSSDMKRVINLINEN